MFNKVRLSQDRIIALDIHTTSPGHEAPAPETAKAKTPVGDPKTDLYVRANQFYLRSRLSRLRRGSSTIV